MFKLYRSSRIRKLLFFFVEGRDQTVLQRSKPISCTALIGEQPNLLNHIQAQGCDKTTSRCQTASTIRTLKSYQPVIPSVPFIRWSLIKSFLINGSLWLTYIKKKYFLIKFLIKISFFQSSIFLALPSNHYNMRKIPLYTFDTFLKVAAPAKLTNNNNKFFKFTIYFLNF